MTNRDDYFIFRRDLLSRESEIRVKRCVAWKPTGALSCTLSPPAPGLGAVQQDEKLHVL